MKLKVSTIEEVLDFGQYSDLMHLLHNFILSNFPQLNARLIDTPTITLIGYDEINKKKSEYSMISMAPQKSNVSLYIVGEKEEKSIIEFYASNFNKSAVGKTCLRLKNPNKIDFSLLKEIVQSSLDWQNLK